MAVCTFQSRTSASLASNCFLSLASSVSSAAFSSPFLVSASFFSASALYHLALGATVLAAAAIGDWMNWGLASCLWAPALAVERRAREVLAMVCRNIMAVVCGVLSETLNGRQCSLFFYFTIQWRVAFQKFYDDGCGWAVQPGQGLKKSGSSDGPPLSCSPDPAEPRPAETSQALPARCRAFPLPDAAPL